MVNWRTVLDRHSERAGMVPSSLGLVRQPASPHVYRGKLFLSFGKNTLSLYRTWSVFTVISATHKSDCFSRAVYETSVGVAESDSSGQQLAAQLLRHGK